MTLRPLEGSTNLLKELQALLPSIGSWHVVRRLDNSQKCSCRLQREDDSASPDCIHCAGAGHPYLEFPERFYAAGALSSFSEHVTSFIQLEAASRVFYALPSSRVATSDVIFEVALDESQRIIQPIRRLARYAVDRVEPLRADRSGDVDLLLIIAKEDEGKP